jgi:hypothetical protein
LPKGKTGHLTTVTVVPFGSGVIVARERAGREGWQIRTGEEIGVLNPFWANAVKVNIVDSLARIVREGRSAGNRATAGQTH